MKYYISTLLILLSTSAFAQSWGEFEGEFGLEEGLVTEASQLSSNQVETSEGSLAALLDAKFNTYFHSTWRTTNEDGTYAYLQVDLLNSYDQVGICYAKRTSGNGNPKTIHVFASKYLYEDNDDWEDQGYVSCTYEYSTTAGSNFAGKTLITLDKKYRYLRLQIEETLGNSRTNNNLYFYWSEFRVFDPTVGPAPASDNVADLVVTEVQTSNLDMFMGPSWNYDGWIEFYNPTDNDISLKGCCLSDEAENTSKYPITGSPKILAKSYGLIWLGEHEDSPKGQVQKKLDADGGTMYLFDGNKNLTHTIEYPAAFARSSWTKKADGTWGYTSNPTPGAENATTGFASAMLEAPVVDIPSQLYQGYLSFNVNIPEGYTLRYTTDGCTPTLTYGNTATTGKFTIGNETGIYRFRFFKDGMLPSAVTTRSFIYTDQKYTVPVAFIVSNPDHFYNDTIGVMVKGTNGVSGRGQSSPCNWNRDWDRPVNFEYMLPDGEIAISQETNLTIAGGWSRANEPHTFKLKANKVFYGNNSLNYPFYSFKPYMKHKAIQFRSGGNDTSCRFIDAANQTIIQTSGIDIDGLAYQPTVHYLNGKYNGVINLREPNNKHFVYANRGWDEEEIDQFEYSNQGYYQSCGTKDALNELRELTKSCADDEVYAEVCKRLDVDEFINYMATEIYMAPGDWLNNNNNCKGYRHRAEDGKFRIIMLDTDSYGGSNSFSVFSKTKNITNHETGATEEFDVVNIFYYLMDNAQFRKKFADTFCMVAYSVFEPSRVQHIVDSLSNNVDAMLKLEDKSTKGSANGIKNCYTTSRQTNQINNMKSFSRLQLSGTPTQQVSISTNIPEARLLINEMPVPTNKFNGTLFSPITLRATANAGYKFIGWTATTQGETITVKEAGTAWKYYDQGSLDGVNWQSPTYSETSWSQGNAPLGYANKDLGFNTVISYGSSSSSKYPTAYFRTQVDIPTGNITKIKLAFRLDDGCVVYVNGTEALRYNMPSGTISFNSFASSYAGDWFDVEQELPVELFHVGTNTIAVEVHQNSASSSDLFWDAALNLSMSSSIQSDIVCEDEEFTLTSGQDYTLTAYYEKVKKGESDERNLPVRINEVSAANTVYANEYFKRNDWVELYNTTDSVIDLAGMYLSDNLTKPHKYQIPTYAEGEGPSTLIEPHGYRIIWCDKQEDAQQLHASFKLSAEDGDILLTEANDLWGDTLHYVAHDGNHTFGVYPDGGRDCYVLSRPTIAKSNELTSYSTYTYSHIIPVSPDPETYILGDANNDGEVTVSDFTAIANHILGNTPEVFNAKAADVNKDGEISVSDLTGVANIILYGSPTGNAEIKGDNIDDDDIAIYANVPTFTLQAGNSITLPISIKNLGMQFSAYQFDITLPEGVELTDANISTLRLQGKAHDFFAWNKMEGNTYRILCASTAGTAYQGNDGTVATLTLTAENGVMAGIYELDVQSLEVSENAQYAKAEDTAVPFIIGNETSIHDINADADANKIFNLAGMKMQKLQKGVNIFNGQKIIK